MIIYIISKLVLDVFKKLMVKKLFIMMTMCMWKEVKTFFMGNQINAFFLGRVRTVMVMIVW